MIIIGTHKNYCIFAHCPDIQYSVSHIVNFCTPRKTILISSPYQVAIVRPFFWPNGFDMKVTNSKVRDNKWPDGDAKRNEFIGW